MGRINLRCACGQPFVVDESVFDTAEFTRCPGCGNKVGIDGPILEGPRRRSAGKPASPLKDARKTHLILGGIAVGAVLFFAMLIGILAFSGGERDRQVADSGHGRPAAGRNPADVRYSTDLFARPMTEPQPPLEPRVAPPPGVAPLPPLPPPDRPVTDPLPATQPPQPVTPKLPAPRVVPPEPPRPLSPGLLRRLREEVLSLPEYYLRSVLARDVRKRAESLLSSGKGTPDDVEFINTLSSDLQIQSARHEYGAIGTKFSALEREALASLPTDQLKMTDGRTLPGRILDVSPTSVRLERVMSRGLKGVMTFPRSQIREIGKGKGVGGEFEKQWKAARTGSVADLESLMEWCRTRNLGVQQEMVAYAILLKDPGHLAARREAGLAARTRAPVAPDVDAPPPSTGPTIQYQGRSWAPRDLREKLLRSGYAIINGRWYVGKDYSVKVPSLFRYARQSRQPVHFTAATAPLNHDSEVSYKSMYDVRSRSFSKQPQINHLRRFYAPTLGVKYTTATMTRATGTMKTYTAVDKTDPAPGTPMLGEVLISVPLEKPLISASVNLKTEVKNGGRITLFLQTQRGRVQIHEISGKYGRSIELPEEHILGSTQVDLVARMTMVAAYTTRTVRHQIRPFIRGDTRGRGAQAGIELIHQQAVPDYPTRLFPSTSNTHEIFRLSAKVGEPAVGLDRLFEPFPDALKE